MENCSNLMAAIKKKAIFLIANKNMILALFAVVLAGCGSLNNSYIAKDTRIQFVDKETKKPLKEVIVLAYWQLYSGHNFPGKTIKLYEVTTNEKGWAILPGWGPETVQKGFLTNIAPQVVVYKEGYDFAQFYGHNTNDQLWHGPEDVTSRWNNEIVELKPFSGDDKELLDQMRAYSGFLRYQYDGCPWEEIPRSYLTILRMTERFVARETRYFLADRDLLHNLSCSKVYQEFQGYR